MPPTRSNETALVIAAQAGDRRALDDLIEAYLPFVYTIVRRTLADDADVDDVVQESMVRAVRELRDLRTPQSFRAWLGAITVRQVSTHLRRRRAAERLIGPLADTADAHAPFEGLTLWRMSLALQRRQAARAADWLKHEDRMLLSLWWLEVAGHLTRAELATAAGLSLAHAAVRIQRLRQQFDQCRGLVAALETRPRCADLDLLVAGWDGVPGSSWRKRIARHLRACHACGVAADELLPAERLLVGLALLPVPLALAATVIAKSAWPTAATSASVAASATSGSAATSANSATAATSAGSGKSAAAATSATAGKSAITGLFAKSVAASPIAAIAVAGCLLVGATLAVNTWPAATPGPGSVRGSAVPSPTRSPAPVVALGPTSLEAGAGSGLFVTTTAALGILAPLSTTSSTPAREQATFDVVPGLADPKCYSFRSRDGRYLRHASWRLRLNANEGTRLFQADATFCVRPGDTAASVHLESSNYPGWLLHRRGNELWVDRSDGSTAFHADSSFRIRPPLAR
ncbi:hypothetical protein Rhe02_36270 [Rhizocola hellebori]|uniref:Sigma-70 family RNA polymerase sigma factor n=1 Tax=Rhizocola hellebori TaxID=1392758 RepID=A0A8J3VGL4_9ACTN|nr:sigma-70 family RNA polymerase sigma factor [Rhizocola hellebori]GIH05560.1 hypothetical protein Rhe02_36270 [Rhizocola hellebori]